MDDLCGGVSEIMHKLDLIKQNYSSDIKDVLNKLDAIVNKCKEKENEKTPKPVKKKPKHANAAFEKIEDGNIETTQNAANESYRLPRAAKSKLLNKKQSSTSIRRRVPVIEIEVLSDNDLSVPNKSISTKIKKEKLNKSPQIRRVTRAGSRNQNLSINSHNGSTERISINDSVQLIPEKVSIITLSEEDEDVKKEIKEQKNIIPVQSEKRITRSLTKSLKKSSNLEKTNTSANISAENAASTIPNNNEEENNNSGETIYEDAISEIPKKGELISKDHTKILENSQQPFVSTETFVYPNDIPTNATFVESIVPGVVGESTFVVNQKLPNENTENILPAETEKTFILSQSEAEKVGILNQNLPTGSAGESDQKNNLSASSFIDLNQNTATIQKPKNTGAIPKQSSKETKNSGVIKKTPSCSVLLKKQNSSSKLYKSPLTTGNPLSAKASPRDCNNNNRKKAGTSVTYTKAKHQSPSLMQIQQEKEFLRRLEQKRLEIEAKDKQKLARQIAMEQQIKKSLKTIQEKKLQIAQNQQNVELNKKEYNFNMLNSEDSTDDENFKSTKRAEPPLWSKRKIRNVRIDCQNVMPIKIIDSFFSVAPLNPDLKEIFPEINPKDLKRNSSIFWRTPPRYSQLPKY